MSFANTSSDWKRVIEKELEDAGVVVFHWEELPTSNMLWEFHTALKIVPVERILILTRSTIFSDLATWIKSIKIVGPSKLNIVEYSLDDDSYFVSYYKVSKYVFEFMNKLRVQDR